MKHLAILVPDEQINLGTVACITGSFQIFNEANSFQEKNGKSATFHVELVGASREKFLDHNHLSIRHQRVVSDLTQSDLIIIPASLIRSYETATCNNRVLIDWVKKQYMQGAEVASMCAGIFTLASTGLLAGRTCSTHWALSDHFKMQFPEVHLQTDKLITDEGGIYTNGGAYSFLHLLIYLIEKHYDRQTAVHCAKYFQIDVDRNLQAEFAIFVGHKKHDDQAILDAQQFIEDNYQEKISIEALSTQYGIGRRSFDRRFIKATGLTPLDYLQRVKIEAAKKSFENTRKNINEVMYDVGYNDTKAFREVFNRVTGMSPIAYKAKYNKAS